MVKKFKIISIISILSFQIMACLSSQVVFADSSTSSVTASVNDDPETRGLFGPYKVNTDILKAIKGLIHK